MTTLEQIKSLGHITLFLIGEGQPMFKNYNQFFLNFSKNGGEMPTHPQSGMQIGNTEGKLCLFTFVMI